MESVSSEKLEAVADFLADNEVDGRFICFFYNKSLKNKIDVPCYTDLCEETCPFYSKENFIKWIKKTDSEYHITNLKRPHQEDFTKYVNCSDALFDRDSYINALEEYCDNLEDVLADTEYDTECIECEMRMLNDKLKKIRGVLDGSH
jgi:hypothetical protein|nr:MAG TPA: hypothetical protein [Caudoviricetes sp.]